MTPAEFASQGEPVKARMITWEMIRRAEEYESHGQLIEAASMGAVRW